MVSVAVHPAAFIFDELELFMRPLESMKEFKGAGENLHATTPTLSTVMLDLIMKNIAKRIVKKLDVMTFVESLIGLKCIKEMYGSELTLAEDSDSIGMSLNINKRSSIQCYKQYRKKKISRGAIRSEKGK
ncbi:hypothetical protein J6590_016863 [Homalodisca vitripennis]|nr:hypothetical protein J6590_016863 [Homalodisca vitripennis]